MTEASLAERVGKGIEWLSAHDQEGRFYFWWQARVDPFEAMPGQDAETIEAYRVYCHQMDRWVLLDRALAAQEGQAWKPWR